LTEALAITTSPRDDHQLEMTIQLGPERTEEALHRAAKLVAKRAKIPGFRPGKAPYTTVLRMFGQKALLGEIVDDLGQEVFKEALEQEKIDSYGQASLEDVQTDPVSFKLVVPLRPSVELGDYQSIRLEAPEVKVEEADVEAALELERSNRMTWEVVERAAEIGDTLVVDIVGTVGETPIMDNHDWELVLHAESGWLPGFDEAFVGMVADEEKSFTLTYPEDSASRYKGQQVNFQTTVKSVKARVLPEANDEFARSLGDFADMADWRAKTIARLTEERTAEAESQFENSAVQALVDKATITYPPSALDDTVHEMLHDAERQIGQAGYKLDDYLRLQGMTPDQYADRLRPAAEKRLKGRLVLSKLAEQEQIVVTPEETQAELDRMVGDDEVRAKTLRDAFGSPAGLALIEADLRTKKTMERLRALVTRPGPEPVSDVAPAPPVEPVAESAAETDSPAGAS
jgi:trigger factor